MKYADTVKERVDALLDETGLKATDLIAAMGISSSTYYDMWKNGYVTVDRLGAMAEVLGVPIARLLSSDEPVAIAMEPAGVAYGKKRFLEERIDWLEAEVRKLIEKTRPR